MTKRIYIGSVPIGGGSKVSVQTMTNTKTEDVKATLLQLERIEAAGADIVRIAVPDFKSLGAFKEILKNTDMPIVADVHYDSRLALGAIEAGAHKIRINPSNMKADGVKEVARLAAEKKIPVRLGFNAGSEQTGAAPEYLVNKALESAKVLEDEGLADIVFSVKSSDVRKTVDAYRLLSKKTEYPLHIGLTESGTESFGLVKSSAAIGALLLEGIGDTIRVSLSAEPEREVYAGHKILRAAGLETDFVEIISCPTCARTEIDVPGLSDEAEKLAANIKKKLKIAVMGCAVNGIGESKGADFGVCGGRDRSIIFSKGGIIKQIENSEILKEIKLLLEEYAK
jgi:1-hydroxy-2-methyl-2-(E)-butenyl 4-diphosphate synthase